MSKCSQMTSVSSGQTGLRARARRMDWAGIRALKSFSAAVPQVPLFRYSLYVSHGDIEPQ
jgi:hypothetical protein